MSKLIIFDFDGTLVDSLSYYLNHAAKLLPKHKKFLTKEYIHKHGIKSLFDQIPIPKIFLPFVLIYMRFRHYNTIKKLKPQKNTEKLLINLSKNNKIGILSSNSKRTINVFVKNNNLKKYVSFIDSSPFYFAKSKNLKKIVIKYPDFDEYYYIGDEQRDIEAAKEAGFKSIAVSWGVESKKLLKQVDPDYVVDDLLEINNIINDK